MFVSVKGRLLVSVEALNMAENIGNIQRHRRVPVVLPDRNVILEVPAVSGEMLAHAYQSVLADICDEEKVCKLCRRKIFVKSSDFNVIEKAFGKDFSQELNTILKRQKKPTIDDLAEVEKRIMERCIVEDIGGFLLAAGEISIRRCSNFFVGYMIPTEEVIDRATFSLQLHTRNAPGIRLEKEERTAGGQMIFNVEIASPGLYCLSFDIDTKYIGVSQLNPEIKLNDKKEREKLALEAMRKFLIERMFGAKKSRFSPPLFEWHDIVIAVSSDVWTVPSAWRKDYIERTIIKLEKTRKLYREDIHLFVSGKKVEENKNVKVFDTPEETIMEAVSFAISRIQG